MLDISGSLMPYLVGFFSISRKGPVMQILNQGLIQQGLATNCNIGAGQLIWGSSTISKKIYMHKSHEADAANLDRASVQVFSILEIC